MDASHGTDLVFFAGTAAYCRGPRQPATDRTSHPRRRPGAWHWSPKQL